LKKILVLLILLVPLNVYSQFVNEFGVKAGLNLSYQTSYDYASKSLGSSNNFIGYNFAAYISMIHNNNFNLLIEPSLIQKGFSQNFLNYGKVSPTLTYLSLAILGKPKLSYKTFNVYLLIGGAFNHLISKNEDIFNGIFENIKSNTTSLEIGLGFQKNVSKKNNVSLELKYDYEIQDSPIHNFVYNGTTYTFDLGETIRNKTIALLLGFSFH